MEEFKPYKHKTSPEWRRAYPLKVQVPDTDAPERVVSDLVDRMRERFGLFDKRPEPIPIGEIEIDADARIATFHGIATIGDLVFVRSKDDKHLWQKDFDGIRDVEVPHMLSFQVRMHFATQMGDASNPTARELLLDFLHEHDAELIAPDYGAAA